MSFFVDGLDTVDTAVSFAIASELKRQRDCVELIASENIASKAVLEAQGSVLTNKYAEGYPGKRYYGGCEYVDEVENIARERAKKLFNCEYVNVQPHSGANANHAVFFAFLKPGDTVLGLNISCGGHLTHGAHKTESGTWFNAITYGVEKDSGLINYKEVERLALRHLPKLIICGASAYSRTIDWAFFHDIAQKIGAILMADIAHYAGLIAAGEYPSPMNFADVVTTTTHKTLRGPRGGMIMAKTQEHAKKLDSAVFPGTQGGPLMHVIAAKAVAFGEALNPAFKAYARQVIRNAVHFAGSLQSLGLDIVSGGTDCHLFTADLTSKNISGKDAEKVLEMAGITCNKNMVPFDARSPFVTSGLRLGTPACTTRGFKEKDFSEVSRAIVDIIDFLSTKPIESIARNDDLIAGTRAKMKSLCDGYPIY